MRFDVSAASRSDLTEMIAAGVVEGAGVDVRGWGRGGKKGGVRKRNGRGTGRSRGRGRGFETLGDLRGMELDSADRCFVPHLICEWGAGDISARTTQQQHFTPNYR